VTTYPLMAEPPSRTGACQDTTAEPSPGIAVTPLGASGAVIAGGIVVAVSVGVWPSEVVVADGVCPSEVVVVAPGGWPSDVVVADGVCPSEVVVVAPGVWPSEVVVVAPGVSPSEVVALTHGVSPSQVADLTHGVSPTEVVALTPRVSPSEVVALTRGVSPTEVVAVVSARVVAVSRGVVWVAVWGAPAFAVGPGWATAAIGLMVATRSAPARPVTNTTALEM